VKRFRAWVLRATGMEYLVDLAALTGAKAGYLMALNDVLSNADRDGRVQVAIVRAMHRKVSRDMDRPTEGWVPN
jgi:hypothetical protein